MFFITYGFANWFTSLRADVPSVVFAWERHIPFWPWTIIPYWSIDALYVVSLFLCRTHAELRAHGLRLATITLVSVACFLLFPLRFSFARPETSGLFGLLFAALTSFDKPYNQAPSLHIGLLWIIALRFAAHTPRRRRWMVCVWAALIAVSVLTTWQHHFIDLVTGFAAGVLVAYALPAPSHCWRARRSARSPRIGAKYLAGAVAALLPLLVAGPVWWTWLFLWPALACALVAAAYFGAGPCVFQKNAQGETAPAAAVLLAPVRLGFLISQKFQARRLPAISRIDDRLFIGCRPSSSALAACPEIGAVLDLTSEFARSSATENPARPLAYLSTPLLDLVPPTLGELEESFIALHKLRSRLETNGGNDCGSHDHSGGKSGGGNAILIHCALGLSRSAVVAAAWFIETNESETPAAAIARLRAARPQIVLHPAHLALLQLFSQSIQSNRVSRVERKFEVEINNG
jgi:protein-tyrosine phosphatase/membrane-associated phospholipid phosphatase